MVNLSIYHRSRGGNSLLPREHVPMVQFPDGNPSLPILSLFSDGTTLVHPCFPLKRRFRGIPAPEDTPVHERLDITVDGSGDGHSVALFPNDEVYFMYEKGISNKTRQSSMPLSSPLKTFHRGHTPGYVPTARLWSGTLPTNAGQNLRHL